MIGPKGFEPVRGGRGNSASRFAIASGPMKMRWKVLRGKRWESWSQTSRGREDSARAPRMKRRTGGGFGRSPAMVGPAPVRGGWRV